MNPGYRPVGYFDLIEWDDAAVCDRCGAVVHTTALDDHDEFHTWIKEARDMAWNARMEQGADLP